MQSRILYLGLGFLLSSVHFVLNVVAIAKTSVIDRLQPSAKWQAFSEVLSFPLVYLSNRFGVPIDGFALLTANSLLWGFAAAFVILTVRRLLEIKRPGSN